MLSGGPAINEMTDRSRALSQKYSIDAMVDGYVALLETQLGPAAARDDVAPAVRPDPHSGSEATEPLAYASAPLTHRDGPLAHLMSEVPRARIGGLPIAVLDRRQTADLMISAARVHARGNRPLIFSSANGEVLSRCSSNPYVAKLFGRWISSTPTGSRLSSASRYMCNRPLPERVATTDLYHDVAARAQRDGTTFYMFGATEAENARACERALQLYPQLRSSAARTDI